MTRGDVQNDLLMCLDEWVGDLLLVEKVVTSRLAKITCPRNRLHGQVDRFRVARDSVTIGNVLTGDENPKCVRVFLQVCLGRSYLPPMHLSL